MKYKLKDLSIRYQAYYIITGLNGSWLYNAMHKELENEVYCMRLVNQYYMNECVGTTEQIEQHINECHDDILAHHKVFPQYSMA